MALKPEISLGAALATGAIVYGTFQMHMPSTADLRTVESGNSDADSAERAATWTAAGIVAAISLIAKDPTIFVVGGGMTVALAWEYRHANHVSPLTGKVATKGLTSASVAAMQMGSATGTGTTASASTAPAYAPMV